MKFITAIGERWTVDSGQWVVSSGQWVVNSHRSSLHLFPYKCQKLAQCLRGIRANPTLYHVHFTTIVKVGRKGTNKRPTLMRRVIMPVDRSVQRPSFPMNTIPHSVENCPFLNGRKRNFQPWVLYSVPEVSTRTKRPRNFHHEE